MQYRQYFTGLAAVSVLITSTMAVSAEPASFNILPKAGKTICQSGSSQIGDAVAKVELCVAQGRMDRALRAFKREDVALGNRQEIVARVVDAIGQQHDDTRLRRLAGQSLHRHANTVADGFLVVVLLVVIWPVISKKS